MGKAVGIDLGTTNSVVAYVDANGAPQIISNCEGGRTTPSVFAVVDGMECIVGTRAAEQEALNPENTVRSVKRIMGTSKRLSLGGKEWSPEEVSAEILRKLKEDAEAFLGEPVTQAVITVPAYFNSDQRQSTKTAGELAGLEVLRIINEPTAAAIAYGLDKGRNERVLVYDLGGGTFDVTVLAMTDDGVLDVLATLGDTHLGGDDFDAELVKMILTNSAVTDVPSLVQAARLRDVAEKVKLQLSYAEKAKVFLPYYDVVQGKPLDISVEISRSSFELAIMPLVLKTKDCVMAALRDAKTRPSDVDQVVFVGGSTRVPMIARLIEEWIGKKPNRSINPDEAVAIGASVQAHMLSGGDSHDVFLMDVIPLSLGVEIENGVMRKMIERNTKIPADYSEVFTTSTDNQRAVKVSVFQGERLRAVDNRLLGELSICGLPPSPRGEPQIEVTFAVDANGILSVSAMDKATGTAQSVEITGSSSLSHDEIAKLIQNAQENAQKDELDKLLLDSRARAKAKRIQVEDLIANQSAVLSPDLREELRDLLESLVDADKADNVQVIDSLCLAAQELIRTASQVIYAAAEARVGG